jgi:tight adherence protein C
MANGADLAISILVFLSVTLFVAGVLMWLLTGTNPLQRRLQELDNSAGPKDESKDKKPKHMGTFLVRWIEPAAKLILPREEWQKSRVRSRLIRAGFRQDRALRVYLGAKVVAALALPLLGAAALFLTGRFLIIAEPVTIVALVLLAVAGFYLPDLYLRHRIEERQTSFREGFPDAMDMLMVCVEAGLGLDAAIQRVGDEMTQSHPILGTEMRLVSLELRAGSTREAALRSLAKRTGIDEVQALTTLLIQAEHFGTSIADALREHANGMRIERIQRAREKAAKLPVKMIFPIMLFIFPALFLVILGPAIIRIVTAFYTVS